MIEVIYKNEEQGQTKEKQDTFKIPNNIRQMGEIKGNLRIYIEDYAYTFLKKLSQAEKEAGETAVLFGECHRKSGEAYIFIKSALRVENMKITEEEIVFTEKIWSWVYENGREYFPGQNVVGWFLHIPEYNVQVTELIRKTHETNFSGKDKVLFLMDPGEQEEAFYIQENSLLQRQNGFYVYYEKNEPMQSYMIAYNKNKSIEDTETTPDRAVLDFRKVFAQKEEEETDEEKSQSGKITKTLQLCAAVALVILGGTAYNHYRTIQSASDTESAANTGVQKEAWSVSADAQTAKQEQSKDRAGEEDTESNQAENIARSTQAAEEKGDTLAENGAANEKSGENLDDGNDRSAANTDKASAAEDVQTEGDASVDRTAPAGEDASAVNNTQSGGSESTDDNTQADAFRNEGMDAENGASVGGAEGGEDIQKEQNTRQTATSGLEEYTIRMGDTLTGICQKKYGSIQRMEEVCEINNIKPEDIIYAGQKIFLPD